MAGRSTIVLDVGKTLSKLSLWTPEGRLLERRTRPNPRIDTGQYTALDVVGIERWVEETLRDFAQLAHVGSIIPVGHGAAAAVIRDGTLVQAPLDYEFPLPVELRAEYDALRDPFGMTGSPALPVGLNLGAQLFYLESLNPQLFAPNTTVLPWPQYWSWLLAGVAAAEVTSLGCHTDLWNPLAGSHSALSVARGWARTHRAAPPRRRNSRLPAAALGGPHGPATGHPDLLRPARLERGTACSARLSRHRRRRCHGAFHGHLVRGDANSP